MPASTTTSTDAPTTTSTSTTTSTAPETTTITPEDLIKQAVQDYTVAYRLCGAAPASCTPEDFTASEGHSRAVVTELATGMAAKGLYFSTDLRGSYLVAETVSRDSATEATAIYCVFDAGPVMGPIGPDGQPTVVNDQVLSIRNQYQLYLEEGVWKVGEQLQLEVLGDGELCPPAA